GFRPAAQCASAPHCVSARRAIHQLPAAEAAGDLQHITCSPEGDTSGAAPSAAASRYTRIPLRLWAIGGPAEPLSGRAEAPGCVSHSGAHGVSVTSQAPLPAGCRQAAHAFSLLTSHFSLPSLLSRQGSLPAGSRPAAHRAPARRLIALPPGGSSPSHFSLPSPLHSLPSTLSRSVAAQALLNTLAEPAADFDSPTGREQIIPALLRIRVDPEIPSGFPQFPRAYHHRPRYSAAAHQPYP
ncbi:MAG: hypothetical protein RLZZ436_3483, partial [Planctomycetota bacterium]